MSILVKRYMKFTLYITSLFLGIVSTAAFGQSEPQYSHYMYNKQLINPAYAGSGDVVEFNALYRTQYVGLSAKASSDEYFGFNMPIDAISSGIGLDVTNDMIGYLRTTSVNVNYDYRKKFRKFSLAVGIGAGFTQTGLQGSKLITPDGIYTGGSVNHNDASVPATDVSGISPNFSAGIYLNNEKWFAGVAVDNIYSVTKLPNTNITYARDLILTGGYDFQVGRHFGIMPSALVRTDLKEVQDELSLTMRIYDNILTGVALRGYSLRSLDAAILYAGFKFKGFRLVYSYDINTSYLSGFNTGSHEISVAYQFGLKKKVTTGHYYYNSRFL
jgi:type IX secretion system PorP/SprF family membrane protein